MITYASEHSYSSIEKRPSSRRYRRLARSLVPVIVAFAIVGVILRYAPTGLSFTRPTAGGTDTQVGSKGSTLADGVNGELCLIFDVTKRELFVRMGGVVLRECTFELQTASDEAAELITAWSGRVGDDRRVVNVHLLSAAPVIPQSELTIIAEETGLTEDVIQRYVPSVLVLVTDGDLVIRVETNLAGADTYLWEQLKEKLRQLKRVLTGDQALRLSLSTQDAMSLYGVAKNRPRIILQ